MNAGRMEGALALFEQVVSMAPHDSRVLIPCARALASSGRKMEAETLLKKACDVDAGNPAPLIFLGILYYDMERFEEAIAAFSECLKRQPRNALARSYRALAQFASGERGEALGIFRKSGVLESNVGFLARFCLLFENELLVKKDALSPAEEEPPSNARIPHKLSERREILKSSIKFLDSGDYVSAARGFRTLYERGFHTTEVVFYLALSLMELGHYERAKTIILEHLKRESDRPEPHLMVLLANACLFLKEFDRGFALLKAVPVYGPDDYNVTYSLGIAYLLSGDREQAQEWFTRAFRNYYIDTMQGNLLPLVKKLSTLT
jgi:tetratricopeptide (TPR) repeat protein